MSIQVDWIDRNISVDKFVIYRATTPILDNALPAVLAEVPGNVFTYLDTTAPRNTVYHYRVAAVVGAERTLSANKPLANIPYTGPGPAKLIRGDYVFGLYGRFPIEDLLSPTELVTQMGWPASSAVLSARFWIKLAVNGKIMFVPDNAVGNSIPNGIKGVYSAGGLYGSAYPTANYSASIVAQLGIVPQDKVVTRGEHQFTIRLPGSSVGTLTGTAIPANQYGGEFDQIIAPLYIGRTLLTTVPAMDDMTYFQNQYCYTRDVQTTAGTQFVTRGGPSLNVDQVYPPGLDTNAGPATTHYWRPVLELVM